MARFLRTRRALAARMQLCIFAVATILLAIPLSSSNFADDPPPPPEEPPPSGDMDGDNVKDSIEPDPDPPGNAPGEVEIRSGASGGTLIVRIRGGQANDRFGYSVAVIDDLNQDGHKDLIIGAPMDSEQMSVSVGRAYVFLGPFLDSGPILITAENADRIFFAPEPGEYNFGDRVAPASDLDGDGVTDLRIRCWHIDENQVEVMRTYFASGLTGDPLYVVEGQSPVDPWAEVAGDADGDGDCDQKDLDAVLANLGLVGDPPEPGSLSRYDGDLNGDGVVDGLDVGIAQMSFGSNIFAAYTPHCPGGVGFCCQGLPGGFMCRTPCDGGDSVGLPGNLGFRCEGFNCDQYCGFGIGGSPHYIDLNTPEVTLTTGGPLVTWFVVEGAIEVLSDTTGQSTFRFRPLSYGPVHIRATNYLCGNSCEAHWYGEIVCMPDVPCDIEIMPPGPGPSSLAVCVLSEDVTLNAEGNWGDAYWGVGIGAELIEVFSQLTDQQFIFSPRQLGPVYLHVVNDLCGHECEDFLTVNSVWIDSDSDGLPDGLELALGLDPFNIDSDGDGTLDGWEDSDGDGFFNIIEVLWGFDANDEDTDDDGILDGQENPDEGDGGMTPPCSATLEGWRFGDDPWSYEELPVSIIRCESDDPLVIQLHTFDLGAHHWSVMDGAPCVVINGDPDQNRTSPQFIIDSQCAAENGGQVILALSVTDSEGNVCTDTLTINFASVATTFEQEDPANWPLGTCPNNGGMSIFPDKVNSADSDDPEPSDTRRKVKVKLHLTPPQAGATVYAKVFDVDDPSSSEAPVDGNDTNGPAGGDNRDPISAGALLTAITDANGDAYVSFSVSMHPGDDYRVCASACEDAVQQVTQAMVDGSATLPAGVSLSSMLTVWRHVYVEQDSMAQPEANQFWQTRKISSFEGSGGNVASATAVAKLPGIAPELVESDDTISEALAVWEDGGRVLVAPSSSGANSQIITGDKIASNDGTIVTFDNSVSIIPSGGLEFSAIEFNFLNSTMSGTVTQIARNGGIYTFTLNITAHSQDQVDWEDFADGGQLTVAGGDPVTIVAANSAASTVTANSLSIEVSFKDDDQYDILPALPDSSLMEAKYAPAYIQPLANGGGVGQFSQMNVPFRAHRGILDIDAAYGEPYQGSRNFARDDCWIVHVVSAFQSLVYNDYDPQGGFFGPVVGEGALISNTSNTETKKGGHTALVYREVIRDRVGTGAPLPPPIQALEATTVAHEVGHLFGLAHIDGTLMSGISDFGANEFGSQHLHLLRSRIHSPGEGQ